MLGESVGGPDLSPTGKEMWVGKTRRNKTVSFSDDVVEIEHQPPCLDVAYIGGEISPHNQSDLNSTLPHREMQEFVSDRPTTTVMVVETRRQKQRREAKEREDDEATEASGIVISTRAFANRSEENPHRA